MNALAQASITTQLATLTRLVVVPTDALVYGRDLSCVLDLVPTLTEVDPSSPTAIVEAILRRYITPRGALLDDADYGLDVRGHCNRGVTRRDLRALSGAMQGEAQKDDRVARAEVTLIASMNDSLLTAAVTITPADSDLQEFSFTFAVTDASVLLGTING